jgi:superfamily II DNA helicase RecQ
MQIKLFTIPITDTGAFLEEMNTFLRSNKILEIENQFIRNENGASWCFCIKYLKHTKTYTTSQKPKIDYKQVLDEATFKKFSILRAIRKKIAADEAIPAFMVFIDEELAALAKLDELTPKKMLSIKGIGDKKVERFAERIINEFNQQSKNETSRKSD